MTLPERLELFAGNTDAADLFDRLVFVAHAWDDLIDRDKPVDNATINSMVINMLLHLPGNAFYRKYEGEMRAMFSVGVTGYLAANLMEKTGDAHKVEIAHYMRYAVVSVVTFMLMAIHGIEKASGLLADVLPYLIPERLADYAKEHLSEII